MRQLSIILVLFLSLSLTAQDAKWCGTSNTAEARAIQTERLLNRLQTIASGTLQFREIIYVPIKFHLSARNDGTGRINEAKVLDQLCEINEDFAPFNLQFFLADGTFNYINNTVLYENHSAVQNSIMEPQRDSRAINVWIVKSVDDGGGGGVTLAYYHTIRDWIVVRKASIKGNDITLSHELGHFFALSHTFHGWESEFYLTVNEPAPAMSSSGTIPTELMDGSNCEEAGDLICDTAPDYGFSSPCDFNTNILDPNGDQVFPDETNYMSYFLSCDDENYYYSDTQNDVMQADYNSNFRNYLRLDPAPDYAEINGIPEHIYPTSGITVDYYNSVTFQWSAVSGAERYFIEISRTSSFTINPIRRVVNATSILIEDLEDDKKYYWRVRPFNAHVGCTSYSTTQSFESGIVDFTTSTSEVSSFLGAFVISPNPVTSSEQLTILLQLKDTTTGDLRLMDATGRLVQHIDRKIFPRGDNRFNIETLNLPNGLYFLQFKTTEGQATKKVVIAK